ncbi:hypothetical protein PIB30_099719 [Stylosanthes scabra]|uniref:Uncharacterized protein n=1 Tax=Stylosanthes scabra TaxID=79078 RepID=A0ABU6WV40_9FABA|nr:hypothetical protein [Stylosanthes scabra]
MNGTSMRAQRSPTTTPPNVHQVAGGVGHQITTNEQQDVAPSILSPSHLIGHIWHLLKPLSQPSQADGKHNPPLIVDRRWSCPEILLHHVPRLHLASPTGAPFVRRPK